MADFLDLTANADPEWRDAAGRFARVNVGNVLAKMVQTWGQKALADLRVATPVRTGEARRSWRADYLPSSTSVKVTNSKTYVPFLITGTRPHDIPGAWGHPPPFGIGGRFEGKFHPGTRPNPQLVAAVERLEKTAAVDLHQAGVEILQQLSEQ